MTQKNCYCYLIKKIKTEKHKKRKIKICHDGSKIYEKLVLLYVEGNSSIAK